MIAGLALLGGLVACSGDDKVCAPGGTQPCTCPGGGDGGQVCDASGMSWGACVCGKKVDGGGQTDGPGGDGPGADVLAPDGPLAGCTAGHIKCSGDGYGQHYCGYNAGKNAYGMRVPCDASDKCTAGKCAEPVCNSSEVIVLLDRSSSIIPAWSWVSNTVMNAIKLREKDNYFGFRLFPESQCSPSGLITPAKNAYAKIKAALKPPTSGLSTPIGSAMKISSISYGDPNVSQAVILITDGDETCGTQQSAAQSASSLFYKGVYVYTIAVTTTANRSLLDKIAVVGGTPKSFFVSDAASLKGALDTIFQQLNSCICATGCTINSACVPSGKLNPTNKCQVCDPAKNKSAWSTSTKGCQIGATCYTAGVYNPANSQCQKCDPSKNPTGWSSTGTACQIGPKCYASGYISPTYMCHKCDPTKSTSNWSTVPGGPCVSTAAGSSKGNANGKGTKARFHRPTDLLVHPSGGLLVADWGNFAIRRYLKGNTSTWVKLTTTPYAMAIDAAGVVYVAGGHYQVLRIGYGKTTTLAGSGSKGSVDGSAGKARFGDMFGIAVDASGVVYVSDTQYHKVRQISGGQVTTLAGSGKDGYQDGPAGAARFDAPMGLAVDSAGKVYVADHYNNRVRVISGGTVSTFAGNGAAASKDGPATTASLHGPWGLAMGSPGKLYVADNGSQKVRLIEGGQVKTLAGSGKIGTTDGAAIQASFNRLQGVAAEPTTGRVWIADSFNHRIRLYTPCCKP